MPDLGNLSSLALARCPNVKLPGPTDHHQPESSTAPPCCNSVGGETCGCNWEQRLRFPISSNQQGILTRRRSNKSAADPKSLDYYLKAWAANKVELGVPESKCFLPFLVRTPKLAECRVCQNIIYPGQEVLCTVRACQGAYHLSCAKDSLGFLSSRKFKCPQHACFLCKQKLHLWRCARCPLASHDKCAAFPEHVFRFTDQPGKAICWKHFSDCSGEKDGELLLSQLLLYDFLGTCLVGYCCPHSSIMYCLCQTPTSHPEWTLVNRTDFSVLNKQHPVPTSDLEEIFQRLPLPFAQEEFKIDLTWKDIMAHKMEPPPYVHIRRNVYLVKKKRDDVDRDIGCTSCSSNICSEDCVCRVQCISCSKACHCSDACTNRPFRKEKKIKTVMTQLCGWGVEAAEAIAKGDFIIEYIGEVISDALCEQRLWDMKYRGLRNFYMCEIRKDFTIDATFKGNSSRFLNHSCDPNCNLEKWQVEGETRVGVFAARSIAIGEPLTYDYRFVQFGPEVKCQCGAPNCQGYLGTKKKIVKVTAGWGSKRQRTRSTCLAILKL